jgi:hypothetical protein
MRRRWMVQHTYRYWGVLRPISIAYSYHWWRWSAQWSILWYELTYGTQPGAGLIMRSSRLLGWVDHFPC